MEINTEPIKTFKTPVNILNAMRKYQENHREEINLYAKEKYRETKNDPEWIERRKEYNRRAYEKKKLLRNADVKEKEHKTPDYTLRAVTKYQQNNRELINKKAIARYYKKKKERDTENENQELV